MCTLVWYFICNAQLKNEFENGLVSFKSKFLVLVQRTEVVSLIQEKVQEEKDLIEKVLNFSSDFQLTLLSRLYVGQIFLFRTSDMDALLCL